MFQKGSSSSSELPSVQIWERKWRGGWIVRVSEPCMPNYDLISSVTIYLTQKKLSSPPPKVPKSSHNSVHLNKDVIHTSQKNLRLFLYHNLLPRSFKKSPNLVTLLQGRFNWPSVIKWRANFAGKIIFQFSDHFLGDLSSSKLACYYSVTRWL